MKLQNLSDLLQHLLELPAKSSYVENCSWVLDEDQLETDKHFSIINIYSITHTTITCAVTNLLAAYTPNTRYGFN